MNIKILNIVKYENADPIPPRIKDITIPHKYLLGNQGIWSVNTMLYLYTTKCQK